MANENVATENPRAVKDYPEVRIYTEAEALRRLCEKRGIPKTDFLRIHDELYGYLLSWSSPYPDGRARLDDSLKDLYFETAFVLSISDMVRLLDFMEEQHAKYENYLNTLPSEVLAKPMVELRGKVDEYGVDFSLEFSFFFNSAYSHLNIPITVKDWLEHLYRHSDDALKLIRVCLSATPEELTERYGYTKQHYDEVLIFFREAWGLPFNEALGYVVKQLPSVQHERAYFRVVLSFLYYYADGLDMQYWQHIIDSLICARLEDVSSSETLCRSVLGK